MTIMVSVACVQALPPIPPSTGFAQRLIFFFAQLYPQTRKEEESLHSGYAQRNY